GPEAWGSRRPAVRGGCLLRASRPCVGPPSALRPPPSALRPPPPVRGSRRYRPLAWGAGNRHRRAFLAGFCPVLGRQKSLVISLGYLIFGHWTFKKED